MLESKIEKELREKVRSLGGKAYKFSSPGNNGVPDRIVLYKGHSYFIELKKPGEDLTPRQKVVKKHFSKLGFEVYKIDSVEMVDKFVREVLQREVSTS
ncbi:MAG: VRR-NUC domain-containing protein [Rikenellaceae bacterium]